MLSAVADTIGHSSTISEDGSHGDEKNHAVWNRLATGGV
jgi:hypothetical protein